MPIQIFLWPVIVWLHRWDSKGGFGAVTQTGEDRFAKGALWISHFYQRRADNARQAPVENQLKWHPAGAWRLMDSFNPAKCFENGGVYNLLGFFSSCILPKHWYTQMGKWVVFVTGNRCSHAHDHMPCTEKNSPPSPLVAQRMVSSWAQCILHKRVFGVPLRQAFIWGYDCSQGTMRADRVPVIVINGLTQIRAFRNTWEAG